VKRQSRHATEPVVTVGPGEGLYNSVCQACHVAGVAGAPKTGDAAAWAPRISNGKDYLYNSVINGKNMMPARGGATNASDDDIKAAVDFMLSKVQ
jgi:cytochrome c5